MKNIKIDYIVKNSVFEDGELFIIELPISEHNYNLVIDKRIIVKQTIKNAIIRIANMQGFQYAEIKSIYYKENKLWKKIII